MPRKVTDGLNSQTGVSVSTDSSRLMTVEERTLYGIWRMRSTQTEDAEPASPESANSISPLWAADGRIAAAIPEISPDGKWIVFMATGAGHWPTLRRVGSTGGRTTELNDKMWFHPAISPDGKSVTGSYADHPRGTQNFPDGIAVIDSAGGAPRKVIAIPPSIVTSAGIGWSPDGREITYVDHRKEGANIWVQPLNGGAPRQLTHFHGYNLFSFDWSRDGKKFVFSRGIKARDVVLLDGAKPSR